MKATTNRPEPVICPPLTVTIEFSEKEAAVVYTLVEQIYNKGCGGEVGDILTSLEDALYDAAAECRHACFTEMFQYDEDGDLSVRDCATVDGK